MAALTATKARCPLCSEDVNVPLHASIPKSDSLRCVSVVTVDTSAFRRHIASHAN